MLDLIKSAIGALARFALAGFIPVAVSLAISFIVYATSFKHWEVILAGFDAATLLASTALYGLMVVTGSVLLSFLLFSVYRVLEGYNLPKTLERRLRARQVRKWHRLNRVADLDLPGHQNRLIWERLSFYPESQDEILPSALGNALRRLEAYGESRFGLDSQSYWYELLAVAPDPLRKDTEDSRTQVDFFVSLMVCLTLTAFTTFAIAKTSHTLLGVWIGLAALALVPLAYHSAVISVLEYRYSVQALINLGRLPLAKGLGLTLPHKLEDEREMWDSFFGLIATPLGEIDPSKLDQHRGSPEH